MKSFQYKFNNTFTFNHFFVIFNDLKLYINFIKICWILIIFANYNSNTKLPHKINFF